MSERFGMEISSRNDFRRVLSETRNIAKQLMTETPEFGPYQSIVNQLQAIANWTSHGRTPTEKERESLNLGLIAMRELENNSEPSVRDFTHRIYEICDYLDRTDTT